MWLCAWAQTLLALSSSDSASYNLPAI